MQTLQNDSGKYRYPYHPRPAYGILDKNRVGFSAGCQSLKRAVKRIQPKLHVFGHIHESSGMVVLGRTTFMNECVTGSGKIVK